MQGYALGIYEAIKTLYPKREISCFLVTYLSGNPPVLNGILVMEITSFAVNARETMGGLYAANPCEMTDEDVTGIFERSFK